MALYLPSYAWLIEWLVDVIDDKDNLALLCQLSCRSLRIRLFALTFFGFKAMSAHFLALGN